MLSDVTIVLESVGLAVVGFVTLIVVCAVVLRLIEVVLPTEKPSGETAGEPDPEQPGEPNPEPPGAAEDAPQAEEPPADPEAAG